jgi:hypothetical protein
MNNFRTSLLKALEVAGVEIPRRKRSSPSIDDVFPLKSNLLEKKTTSPNEAWNFTSEFYKITVDGSEISLEFPADEQGIGPFWNEDGIIDLSKFEYWDEEIVSIVSLGDNRYRLAVNPSPFSGIRLYWGDEFIANKIRENTLRITSICTPQPYFHARLMISGTFNNEHQVAHYLHSHNGGWEAMAGGILTLTVPAEHRSEFQRLLDEVGR